MLRITVEEQAWPLIRPFVISRGARGEARTIIVTLSDEAGNTGRGEAVPYARYGETIADAMAQLRAIAPAIENGLEHAGIPRLVSMKAARNALDCALWDLRARQTGRPVWQLAGLRQPEPLITAFTISLGRPEEMAAEARRNAARPLLKLKLGAGTAADDMARVAAARKAAPKARIIIDANEAWREEDLPALFTTCHEYGIELIEQPLPAGEDAALARMPRPVPVCADESAHDLPDLPALSPLYDAINIKLDKTGGLTPALELARAAQDAGLALMTGCMLASSLAMAPAFLVAQMSAWTDLDGPLLLAADASPPMREDNSTLQPPAPALWG